MSEIGKRIGNAKSMTPKRKHQELMSPTENEDVNNQYGFRENTAAYVEKRLKYAHDMFTARVQGIDENDFYKWFETKIRISQMVHHGTTTNIIEDWKEIKFESKKVNAIGLGAKIECNGNTYIVANPDEDSGVQATAICRRCNATWRHLDFYGNVLEEPFYWARNQSQASANEYLDYMVTPNLYQKCVIQLNDQTKDMRNNRRMVLGTGAYMVRGLVDFLQSETGNRKSTHILYFDLQSQEPIDKDDMENHIADAYGFEMYGKFMGVPEKTVPGQTFAAAVETVRNGQTLEVNRGRTYGVGADGEREYLGRYPVEWDFSSGDTSVATITKDGTVTAVGEGNTVLRATLRQNPNIVCETGIAVSAEVESRLEWTASAEKAEQYQEIRLECRWTENGAVTADVVTYTVVSDSGIRNSFEWKADGYGIKLTGYVPDTLTVRAEANGAASEIKIVVMGY